MNVPAIGAKPVSFNGSLKPTAIRKADNLAFTGVPPAGTDYGKIFKPVKDAFNGVNWSGMFNSVKTFILSLPERLKPVNDALTKFFSSIWQKLKPVSTKVV